MTNDVRGSLQRQLETAWKLMSHHLDGLTTEECLWRPARQGLHVQRLDSGAWRAEWPDRETYDLGPPSIAWLTWHVGFWWSMAHAHSFGTGALTREQVLWPGDAQGVRVWLTKLKEQWTTAIDALSDAEWQSTARTRWPYQDRPFADIVAWVNLELAKNAAEIGYARFLYGVRGA